MKILKTAMEEVRKLQEKITEHEAIESRIMEILEVRYDLAEFEYLRLGEVREIVDLIRDRRLKAGKE